MKKIHLINCQDRKHLFLFIILTNLLCRPTSCFTAPIELNFSLSPSLVPDDQETRSEMSYPSSRSRFGQPARSSSSRAMMPPRRLDTLREMPSVSVLDESSGDERNWTSRGPSRTKSSSSDSRLPASRRRLSGDSGTADNLKNGHQEADEKKKEEGEEEEPSSPPPVWAAEPRDGAAAQNPLLRRPQWKPTKR